MLQDISVVICAYTERRWAALLDAVSSVKNQTLPAKDIIVVIDHNTKLYQQAKENIQGGTVIENSSVKGLSGARNSGIALATGEIIAFLDDDAVAEPDWLQSLLEPFIDSQVLGVGGSVRPLWVEKRPFWLPEEFYWVVGCTYRGIPHNAGIIRNPIGANMAFRRMVFEEVGGFRCEIGRIGIKPMGCEETELCIRTRQHWSESVFLYVPSASVSHRVPPARTTWHYFFTRCYSEGLSKAAITRYVGVYDGLSSEKTYTFRTLPEGVLRGMRDLVMHGDWMGLACAVAIIVGLLVTTIGYVVGSMPFRLRYRLEPMMVIYIILSFEELRRLWRFISLLQTGGCLFL